MYWQILPIFNPCKNIYGSRKSHILSNFPQHSLRSGGVFTYYIHVMGTSRAFVPSCLRASLLQQNDVTAAFYCIGPLLQGPLVSVEGQNLIVLSHLKYLKASPIYFIFL